MLILDAVQGARHAETGMYIKYMRILSTAQRRNAPKAAFYLTSNNSTSKIKVAFGGITPPAPRAP